MNNPEAYIAKNKSRLRVYNNDTVYMNNGDEFQLEFFNPTTSNILAKFTFNGKNVDDVGLVIRPGDRVFLDRYLNKQKKFKFESYDVDNTSEVREAIRNSGEVFISFYNEKSPNQYTATDYSTDYTDFYKQTFTIIPSKQTFTSDGITFPYLLNTCGDMSFSTNDVNCYNVSNKKRSVKSATPEKIKTGIVSTGNVSNQKLTDIDIDFETFFFHTIKYQIKPIENKTTENLAVYCTNCGYRKRKSHWLACPMCGEKFEF